MNRKNKILFVLSILVIFAPLAVGLALWNKLLPAFGAAEGFMLFTIVFLPIFFLLLHFLCVGFTLRDYKKHGQSEKIVMLAILILPLISIFAFAVMYATILKGDFVPYHFVYILVGGLFILMGNYMPKARRNRMFGLRNMWTLASDEVWTKSHRFLGKISVLVGALLLLCMLLPQSPTVLIVSILASTLIMAGSSTVYSYIAYKNAVKEGKITKESTMTKKSDKIARAVTIPLVAVVLIVAAVLCFTGSIAFTTGESSLLVDATYWRDKEIAYEDIASIALIDDTDASRVSGFGSPMLSLGLYKSDNVGSHTRFAYTKAEKHILLTLKDGSKIVLGAETAEETTALYGDLLKKIS